MTPELLDRMRRALGGCTFLPASAHKRFARNISAMDRDKITEKQQRQLIRLAWRYRRQMPRELVPSKDAIEALDGRWEAMSVAGVTVYTTAPAAIPAERPHLPARATGESPALSILQLALPL